MHCRGASCQRGPVLGSASAASALVLAAVVSVLLPTRVSSQEIRGELVAREGGEAIGGALVELVTETGVRTAATVSGEDGRFSMAAEGEGTYRIRIERIGFETWVSDPFRVERDGARLRLEVPIRPIPLDELRVVGESRCRSSAEDRRQAHQRYREALQALELVVRTESWGFYLFRLRLWEEGPDRYPSGVPIEAEHYESFQDPTIRAQLQRMGRPMAPDTFLLRRPVESLQPAELAAGGYIRPAAPAGLRYFAPVARTLVSEEFLSSHCVRAVEDGDGRWRGLAFEPVPDHETPDVKGVLWLTGEGEPRPVRLEWEFTRVREMLEMHELPAAFSAVREDLERSPETEGHRIQLGPIEMRGEFGGYLEFERVGEDSWITRRWEIRTPRLWHFVTRSRDPPSLVGNPVALQRARRGEVLEVLRVLPDPPASYRSKP